MFNRLVHPDVHLQHAQNLANEFTELQRQVLTRSDLAREAYDSLRREYDIVVSDLKPEVALLLTPLFSLTDTCDNQTSAILDLQKKLANLAGRQGKLVDNLLANLRETYLMLELCAIYRDYAAELRDVLCVLVEKSLGQETMKKFGWAAATWRRIQDKRNDESVNGSYTPVDDAYRAALKALDLTNKEFMELNKFRKDAADLFHKKNWDLPTAVGKLETEKFPKGLLAIKPSLRKALGALQGHPEEVEEVKRRVKFLD